MEPMAESMPAEPVVLPAVLLLRGSMRQIVVGLTLLPRGKKGDNDVK